MNVAVPDRKMTVSEFLAWWETAIGSVAHDLIVYDDRRFVVHHRRTEAGPIETTFVSQGEVGLIPPGIRVIIDGCFGEA